MFKDAWKYIAERRLLFGIVVIVMVFTPIVLKVIDSMTAIRLAQINTATASIVPDNAEVIKGGKVERIEQPKENKIAGGVK